MTASENYELSRTLPDETSVILAGASHRGKVRENQEDAWRIQQPEDPGRLRRLGRLLLVCDGVGGSRFGEVASQLAADTIVDLYFEGDGSDRVTSRLRNAIRSAHNRILEAGEERRERRGMASTVAAAVIQGDRLTVGWAGDTRVYLLRGRETIQVTRDHSVPGRSGGLTRCLGAGLTVDPDLREVSLQPGDRVLICSDGLHGVVTKEDLARSAQDRPERWADDLIRLALRKGGPDNVTVVAAQVLRLPFAPHHLPELHPGTTIDDLVLRHQLRSETYHHWWTAETPDGPRLLCILRPDLQDDPLLALQIEEEGDYLERISGPDVAQIEAPDRERSLLYVRLKLPDRFWTPEAPPLQPLDRWLGESPQMTPDKLLLPPALQIGLQIARGLQAVRDSLLPAGAPHPSDFWGAEGRFLLCRWPGPLRQYGAVTGRGVQVNPEMAAFLPPDFGPDEAPGPAADRYFVGVLLKRLLKRVQPGSLDQSVETLIERLLSPRSADRPDAVEAIGRELSHFRQ